MDENKVKTAVILAAGWGSRVQALGDEDENVSKPLIELNGTPLLVRTIRTLHRAGIERFIVVTGYLKERVEEALASLAASDGLDIRPVFNERWNTLANGVSLLAAKDIVTEPFLLSMADHAYDVEIPRMLLGESMGDLAVLLCIDRKLDQVFDMDDATKVVTEDDRIIRINKSLEQYNAVDIGLFSCLPDVFGALEQVLGEKGDCSLSDGMKILGESGRFGYMDVGEYLWQDVDTPETLVYASKLLSQGDLRFPD